MKKEIKIGLILILALGSLIWGLNFLKGKNFFSKTKNYYVIYDDVSGLLESNGVYVKGYKVGYVSDISFSDSTLSQLKVVLAIKNGVHIPKGSRAKIYNLDLIGNKAVELAFSVNSKYYNEGDTIIGDIEITFAKQLEPYKVQAYNLLNSMDSLSNSIIKIFDPVTIERLRATIKNIKTTTDLIESSSNDISTIIDNFNTLSRNLVDNNKKINNILTNLNTFSDTLSKVHIQSSINKLDNLIADSHSLIMQMQNGSGTIGKLLQNDSLYNSLNKTTANLDSLITELKKNPKKYFSFSVFGGKGK
jgi:phospholipid/cholesterol/gamma-HCH transport system substrate-binding protein